MKLFTFPEWIAHSGEEQLVERITSAQRCYLEMWERRNERYSLWSRPAWELCMGLFWQENLDEWHARWARCGGKLHEGRMVAAKWDRIWESLSSSFYDGLGKPYPPYAKSSCAYWTEIGQDEAIVMGVISESEFESRLAAIPQEPVLGRDGKPLSTEFLEEMSKGLEEEIFRNGGPRPGASRAERVAHYRAREEESAERMQLEYQKRNRQANAEREAQNATFRLLEEVERTLKEQPIVNDKRRWDWMCEALKSLTDTKCFERYPNWKARAWLACADMHKMAMRPADELDSLNCALGLNPKLAVKRRIATLQKQVGNQ